MEAGQLIRVAMGVLRDGPTPLVLARRAIREFDAVQRTWELQSLLGLVRRMKPVTVLEIGTYKGGTLACWPAVTSTDAHIISIDTPFSWGDKEVIAASLARAQAMIRPSQRLTTIAADSHDPGTLLRLKEVLAGAKIDVLWIDGDHTYEGVTCDVDMYGPLVRKGGIIAMHDIRRSDLLPRERSDLYWEEIKTRAPTREFIAQPAPGQGMGIGVIFVERENIWSISRTPSQPLP